LLVLCVLGKSYGFSSGSFSFTNLVLANATNHTRTRCSTFEKNHELKRKTGILILIIGILIVSKFWIGIFTHDEFGGKDVFIKHRPIWKTFFYSPRGMSDLKLSEMSTEKQNEQILFDEFVLENRKIE
jgi:hypothetical protein